MLHDLQTFQNLVRSGNWCYLNERRPFRTRDKLDWTDENVAEVLCALTIDDCKKTVPNCSVTAFVGCEFVDADQYLIFWDEENMRRRSEWNIATTIELSLKIAIVTDAEGQAAGPVTFHLSGEI